jgi:hypothetical protein
MCAVSRPWHDEVLPLGTNVTYPMNGYAYTGGQLVSNLLASLSVAAAVTAAAGQQRGVSHDRLHIPNNSSMRRRPALLR